MFSNQASQALSLVFIACLAGCAGLNTLGANVSAPILMPTSEDMPRLAKLADELEANALQCLGKGNCEQVYFARAMVSLFENREAARASFRHVINYNPASPLAHSSELWLQLIGRDQSSVSLLDDASSPLPAILAPFLRAWMERQLTDREKPETNAASTSAQDVHVLQFRIVQGMQRQVRDRDRQIAELRSQLDALKVIDQDHASHRTVKAPLSLKRADQQ